METPPRSAARLRENWRFRVALTFLACLIPGSWLLTTWLRDPARDARPLRIGFQSSLPYQTVTPDGLPAGPAIDIIPEAARRRHIPLQWFQIRGRLTPIGCVPLESSGISNPQETVGRSVQYGTTNIDDFIANEAFPDARLMVASSPTAESGVSTVSLAVAGIQVKEVD